MLMSLASAEDQGFREEVEVATVSRSVVVVCKFSRMNHRSVGRSAITREAATALVCRSAARLSMGCTVHVHRDPAARGRGS